MLNIQRNCSLIKDIYSHKINPFIESTFSIVSPAAQYEHNWHIDALSEYLMACYHKQITRLIINVPPRSLKSISCSIAFPAWILGKNPSEQIIVASYAQKLSNKLSQDTRLLMQTPLYQMVFPDTIIAPDQNEKSKFMTTKRGHRIAASVGAGVIGEGANYIIVDDLLNPKTAASEAERVTANEFFDQGLYPRLNDKREGKSVIIIIMQRLHQKDLTGHLLAEGGWEHLCLPVKNDRERIISIGQFEKFWGQDELLFPELLNDKVIEEAKSKMKDAFAGQFLQRPSNPGGTIIKEDWWRIWKKNKTPKVNYIIQVYDTAFGTNETNDFSASTTWGIFEDDDGEDAIILLDMMKKRMDFPALKLAAKESYMKYRPNLILIEAKSSGQSLIDEMRKMKLPVRPIERNRGRFKGSNDKRARAHMATVLFEQGLVWVPGIQVEVNDTGYWRPRKWAQEVIDDCSLFPKGENDDIVDTVVDAVTFLRQYKGLKVDSDRE